MSRRAVLIAGLLSLGARLLLAQIPPDERIPVTDPDRLQAMGFPRDAKNIYVWSKAAHLTPPTSKAASSPETWGTAGGYTNILGSELTPGYSLVLAPDYEGRLDRGVACYDSFFYAFAFAQLQLPEGARLNTLRFWAYDSVDPEDLIFDLYEINQPGTGSPTTTLVASTKTFLDIGDYVGFASLNDLVINNRDCTYHVRVQFAAAGEECRGDFLRVRKLQVTWYRQVSPAPAVASFDDVPTNHPFFQFIEALSKSGTTAGCQTNPPLYCPERPITRGEMAVYLAKALGLQWP